MDITTRLHLIRECSDLTLENASIISQRQMSYKGTFLLESINSDIELIMESSQSGIKRLVEYLIKKVTDFFNYIRNSTRELFGKIYATIDSTVNPHWNYDITLKNKASGNMSRTGFNIVADTNNIIRNLSKYISYLHDCINTGEMPSTARIPKCMNSFDTTKSIFGYESSFRMIGGISINMTINRFTNNGKQIDDAIKLFDDFKTVVTTELSTISNMYSSDISDEHPIIMKVLENVRRVCSVIMEYANEFNKQLQACAIVLKELKDTIQRLESEGH